MRITLFLFMSTLVLTNACNKSSVVEPPPASTSLPIRTARDLPADTGSASKFTYFSLRDSAIVVGVDTTTNKWDLAFASTSIRTNSGTSGAGTGGAVVLSQADFDTLSMATASAYSIDTSATKLAIRTGSDNGWYHYDFATNIITPVAGRVLVIRTGDGKYAKVQIVSYYKGAPAAPTATDKSRYYTFKYVYQPDGSAKLR